MGKGSIVNGNTTLVIEDGIIQYEADPSKGAVVGGNYIKASSPDAGMVSQTNSTVRDTSVTINGGTFGGSVYRADVIDQSVDNDQPEEALYFSRYEVMEKLLLHQYPSLSESFTDHMIELLYAELF